jgi:hypothetical protein
VIWASTAAASETSGSGRVSSESISDKISTPPACNKNKITCDMKMLFWILKEVNILDSTSQIFKL